MAARKSPEQVRQELMDAGAGLIAEHGFEGVNSNQIARAAGVGVGSFYRHFEDKAALVEALRVQIWERLGSAMPTGTRVGDFARASTEAVVSVAEQAPATFRAAFGTGSRSRRVLSLRPIERRFRELAQQAGIEPSELDPAVAARAWWSMISGTLLWWLEDPDRSERTALLATLTRLHPASRARVKVRHSGPRAARPAGMTQP